MILTMSKVRLLGPRDRLDDVLRVLQDLGILHLAAPESAGALAPLELSPREARERRQLHRILEDLEHALAELRPPGPPASRGREAGRAGPAEFARWARLAGRVRREAERLAARAAALEEERALILKYRHFFSAFRALLESEARWPNAVAYHVLLRASEADALSKLRTSLRSAIGEEFQLYTQRLPTGEIGVLLVVSSRAAGRVERLLTEARVQEIPVPEQYGGKTLSEAIPRMLARLDELPREEAAVRRERERLAREHGPELVRARAAIHDRLRELEARQLAGATRHAFVLEGWVPRAACGTLRERIARELGDLVIVSELSEEEWESQDAPVVLSNPRLFRPFEALIRPFPLPRYGSIDPTPFVAVFFPAFFGIMVGDVGYGLVLAALALVVRWRSRPESLLRSAAEIAGACAVFTIVAGLLYGEFFGDLGRRWLGLRPLAFNREEALIPFLVLAVSLGLAHVLLGLLLAVASNLRRRPRHAVGSGVAAIMIVAIVFALLAAIEVLPSGFFTPAVIVLLVAFPLLIVAEGVVAPIELLSSVGNILSYARIMALGVASVMLAVVANRMVGALGSAAVGVLFALLFHLVNFGIALFSPTIHALRLHYVEFFGKFYSPGGVRYAPFGHWSRDAAPRPALR
ncbi:MAG TPA: V-type ATPase 116kDa subunit family protein [Gemmatimonadales bacterium]|nr:V-type ATPase 116kDa subunit family protein [Gemmatimonadales bacterium]